MERKFKQTDVGLIPETWSTACLSSLTEKIGSGATPRGGKESYQSSGVSLIRSQNVLNGRFSHAGLAFINAAQAEELDNVEVRPRDVLLNITGDSVARCCSVLGSVLPARVNQHVSIIRTNDEQLNPLFLQYYLNTPQMQQYMLSAASAGATRPALTKTMIENFFVIVPSIAEQEKIAQIFSDLDTKIKLNQQMNKTLESIARALFKRWFVDFEFPGHENIKFVGNKPLGWREVEFGEIVSCVRDQVHAGEHLSKRKYVPIECMPMNQLWLSEYKNYTEAQSSLITFEKGDIIFGAMRAYFHRVNYAPFAGITRTTVFVLRPKKIHWLAYALCLMNLDESVEYANAYSKGSTMPYAVWENALEKMSVVLPPDNILIEFSRIISPFIETMNVNAEINQRLAQIRDSLLPKLMSGKIRVDL